MKYQYFDEKNETLSRGELEALQQKRLVEMVRYTARNNEYFRKRYEAAGVDPETFRGLEDLGKLPIMSKIDFREQYPDKMCCVPKSRIEEMHMSSGSTGTPVVMLYTANDITQWAECMARCYRMAGTQPGDVLQITPGLGLFNGGFGCFHGGKKAGMFVIPAGPGNTARQIKLAKDLKTNVLISVVSYGTRILEFMKQANTALPDLRIGIFGAETFSDSMKKHLREGFGIDVFDIYGMTETGGIGTLGMDCPAHCGTHVWEDHYIVEVVDPVTYQPVPDGQEGELVVTSLTREAIPVIRFRTGDLTRIHSREKCACGRTHVRIDPVTGRVDDMLIIKGVNFFPSQVEQSLMKIPGVLPNYQLFVDEVNGVNKLHVKVEVEAGVTGYMVEKQLKEDLGFSPDGDVYPPGTLPRTEGKAKRVFHMKNGVLLDA